ncbi:MAG: DUF1579 domain-containing protein [Acidobacteriia bacterium]|nr:DUF1579 domain-containing protein [Terriglobia bacterium]
MRKTIGCLIACLLLGAFAAAQMGPPTPAPELKKLDYFVGTWTLDGDMKPGPFGPGGKMTETEKVEWMQGNFFLVIHSDFKSAMGNGMGMAYMGYNPEDKVYTYDAFNSMGEAEHSKGTLSGDTWTWTSEDKMGGKIMKGRFTIKELSATSYSFKFEMAGEDGNYASMMEGKATKAN